MKPSPQAHHHQPAPRTPCGYRKANHFDSSPEQLRTLRSAAAKSCLGAKWKFKFILCSILLLSPPPQVLFILKSTDSLIMSLNVPCHLRFLRKPICNTFQLNVPNIFWVYPVTPNPLHHPSNSHSSPTWTSALFSLPTPPISAPFFRQKGPLKMLI